MREEPTIVYEFDTAISGAIAQAAAFARAHFGDPPGIRDLVWSA